MLSKKVKYALEAMLYLAEKSRSSQPILISDLAKNNQIPKKFLELILLELKNKGLLASKKGKGGGYLLARRPQDILLGEIIPFQESMVDTLPCLHPKKQVRCDDCRDLQSCAVRMIMKEIGDSVTKILNLTSLADLLEKSSKNHSSMYYI